MSKDTIQVRIDLEGKTKQMFDEIKVKFNLDTNTETIRLIIKVAHDNLFEIKE